MSDESESVLVKLTRMEGKLDLSNLRHDQHDQRFTTIDTRINAHGERITGLENREMGRDGERKGMTIGGRILLSVGSLLVGSGGVLAVLELLK